MRNDTRPGDASGASPTDALVLIHGSGDSARCWDGVLQRLEAAPTRILALDLPGHGARMAEPLPPPTVAAYAAWVRGELRAARIVRAVLAGHSLGSAIVLRLALDEPDLVAHAVLIGAGARLRVVPALLQLARADSAAALARVVELGHATGHEQLARAYLAALAPTAPGALANDLTACDGFDVMADLSGVGVPVTVLVGEDDRMTPPKYAGYLAEHIRDARLRRVPEAGHYLMHEAPDAVAEALRMALADAPR